MGRFKRPTDTPSLSLHHNTVTPHHQFVASGPGTVNPTFIRRQAIVRNVVPVLQMPPVPNTETVFSSNLVGQVAQLDFSQGGSPHVVLQGVSHDVFWLGPAPRRSTGAIVFTSVEQSSGGSVRLSDGSEFENPDL